MNKGIGPITLIGLLFVSGCSQLPEKYGLSSKLNSSSAATAPTTTDTSSSPTPSPSGSASPLNSTTSVNSSQQNGPNGINQNNTGVLTDDTPGTQNNTQNQIQDQTINDIAAYAYMCGGVVCDPVAQEEQELAVIMTK